jgi:hypothetical protein
MIRNRCIKLRDELLKGAKTRNNFLLHNLTINKGNNKITELRTILQRES